MQELELRDAKVDLPLHQQALDTVPPVSETSTGRPGRCFRCWVAVRFSTKSALCRGLDPTPLR